MTSDDFTWTDPSLGEACEFLDHDMLQNIDVVHNHDWSSAEKRSVYIPNSKSRVSFSIIIKILKLRNRWAVFSQILRPTPTPKVPPTPTHLPNSPPTYPPPHPPTHPNHFLSYKRTLHISSTFKSETGHTALGLAAMVTVLLTKTNNISSFFSPKTIPGSWTFIKC